jgi:hypothetical protein
MLKSKFAKGESRACRRTKTKFKSKIAKGENRICKRGIKLDIQIQIVNQIYNKRFQKYLNYHWTQKSMV